jgi:uncharacterized protein (DUF885 family)
MKKFHPFAQRPRSGRFSAFALAALLTGCGGNPQTHTQPPAPAQPDTQTRSPWEASSGTGSDDSVFNLLSEQYIAGYLAWRPLEAVQLGFHEYDGKIKDFSRASIAGELARLKDFDRKLDGLHPADLSPRTFYDFRILRAGIRRELFAIEDMQQYTRNPMTYAGALDVSPYIKRNFAPLEDRVRSIGLILEQAPKVVASARLNLEDSLPKPWVETAIEIGNGSADFLEKDLVDAVQDLKNPQLREAFMASDDRAVREMRAFVKFLKEEKLPRATNQFALGRERFAKSLREGELIMLSPERVLEIGQAELHREQQLFAETSAKIDATRKPIEVFEDIQRDHPTAADLIPDTRKNLEAIRHFVEEHHLINMPSDVRPRVEETLKFDRASSFASMDSPGAFETRATEAYYYVTPVEADWTPKQKEDWLRAFNYYTTDVVSVHEVYPGHFIQFESMKHSSATRVEKILGSYAFVEGWAHYCEQLVIDEGYGSDGPAAAKYRLAQLDEALLRLCRLCVAIQMHCQGMTVDEATKFFEDNCYYGEKPAHSEAMRGTFDPGYCNYTLGKLMILKLRKDYQAQEGASFSLEKFNDEIVRHGMPPVPLLRELLLKDHTLWDQAL